MEAGTEIRKLVRFSPREGLEYNYIVAVLIIIITARCGGRMRPVLTSGMAMVVAASWLLQHLPIIMRVFWLLGIGSILIASIPLRQLGFFHRLIMGFARRGKLMNYSSVPTSRFTVPQSYFLHFYLVGVTWTTLLVLCTSYFAYSASALPASESLQYSSFASHLAGGADSLSLSKTISTVAKHRRQAWTTVLVLLMMEAQVLRRLYESVYVFNYSPSARMHILGYFSGLLFYVAAPLSMCSLCAPEVLSYIVTQAVNSVRRQQAHVPDIEFKWLHFGSSLLRLGWWQWAGALVFTWGWIHQFRCHMILGSLRTENQEETNEYVIPHGDWFEIVTCPHYLAEIVIYAGILIASGGSDLTVWLLFAYVVANLTFVATETHRWYLRKFDNYPRSRWSIIPFLC